MGRKGGIVYDFLATAIFPQLKNNLGTLRGWGEGSSAEVENRVC